MSSNNENNYNGGPPAWSPNRNVGALPHSMQPRNHFAGPPRGNAINSLPATPPVFFPRTLAESVESNQAVATLRGSAPAPSGPGRASMHRPPSSPGLVPHEDLGATARSPYANPYHAFGAGQSPQFNDAHPNSPQSQGSGRRAKPKRLRTETTEEREKRLNHNEASAERMRKSSGKKKLEAQREKIRRAVEKEERAYTEKRVRVAVKIAKESSENTLSFAKMAIDIIEKFAETDNRMWEATQKIVDNIIAESPSHQLTPRANASKKKRRQCGRSNEENPSKKQRKDVPLAGNTSSKDVSSSSRKRKVPSEVNAVLKTGSDAVGGLARSDSAEINGLKTELEEIRELNSTKTEQILGLREMNAKKDEQIRDLRASVETKDEEIVNLRASVDTKAAEIGDLRALVETKAEEIGDLDEKNRQLRDEVRSEEKRIAFQESGIQASKNWTQESNAETNDLRSEVKRLSEERSAILGQLNQLRASVASKEASIHQLRQEGSAILLQRNELQAVVRRRDEELFVLRQLLGQYMPII